MDTSAGMEYYRFDHGLGEQFPVIYFVGSITATRATTIGSPDCADRVLLEPLPSYSRTKMDNQLAQEWTAGQNFATGEGEVGQHTYCLAYCFTCPPGRNDTFRHQKVTIAAVNPLWRTS